MALIRKQKMKSVTTKSLTFGLLLLLLTAATLKIATAEKLSDPSNPINSRIGITYWATPEEYSSYSYLCDYARRSGTVTSRVDTAEYSPTNFFQLQLAAVFQSWVQTRMAIEKDQTVRTLSGQLQELEDKDLAMVQNVIQSMRRTNAPPTKLLSQPTNSQTEPK